MQIKKGKQIFIFIFILSLINFISAIDTQININTIPGGDVTVAFAQLSNGGNSWTYLKDVSNDQGIATFTVSTDTSTFDLIVTMKKDGELLSHSSFDNPYKEYGATAGEDINIEMIPSWYVPAESPSEENVSDEAIITEDVIENETTSTTEDTEIVTTNEEPREKPEITGSSISHETSSNQQIYYGAGLGGLLLAGFIFLFFSKRLKIARKKRGIAKLDKILDEMDNKNKPNAKKPKKDLVDDVKKKMKELENEIEELRKGD